MKLSDWAEKQGISYLTAYRWFRAGKLPVAAYQSESGTIIVQDDSDNLEQDMNGSKNSDVMSHFLKKTVEFSKNNSTIEDFAAYVLSNFQLKMNLTSESPKYSKNKPNPEEVQKHFKQFLKPKGEKPKTNMFIAPEEKIDELVAKADELSQKELVEEIQRLGAETAEIHHDEEVLDLIKDMSTVLNTQSVNPLVNSVKLYGEDAEGIITRSVDLTPQLNYTGSTSNAFSANSAITTSISGDVGGPTYDALYFNASQPLAKGLSSPFSHMPSANGATGAFKPTSKEIQSASNMLEKPRRGRKPYKNVGKK